mgnify:CR=1 FL=1
MSEFVVVGGGGHAKVLMAVLCARGDRVLGYTDRQDRGPVLGAPYLGDDTVLERLAGEDPARCFAFGVGMITGAPERRFLLERIAAHGAPMPTVVAASAVVAPEVELGAATVVFEGVVVNPGVRTGPGCILNTHCTVEHDVELGANVHVAPGATLSGSVFVGDDVMLGTGANVIQGVRIAGGITVGAGATVVGDLAEPGVYVGCPARRVD